MSKGKWKSSVYATIVTPFLIHHVLKKREEAEQIVVVLELTVKL